MAKLFKLVNANVDSAQRISILAAASPINYKLSPRSSLDDFVRSAKYETIASILRQCDTHLPSAHGTQSPSSALSAVTPLCASNANTSGANMATADENTRVSFASCNRPKMTREQLRLARKIRRLVSAWNIWSLVRRSPIQRKRDPQNVAADEPIHEPSHTVQVASDKQTDQ